METGILDKENNPVSLATGQLTDDLVSSFAGKAVHGSGSAAGLGHAADIKYSGDAGSVGDQKSPQFSFTM